VQWNRHDAVQQLWRLRNWKAYACTDSSFQYSRRRRRKPKVMNERIDFQDLVVIVKALFLLSLSLSLSLLPHF
jgi:hypothetical protein